MKPILIIVAAVCLVVGLVACGGTSTGGESTPAGAASTPAASTPAADSGGTAADGWVEVVTLTGNADKPSPSFTLEGGDQKLTYTIKGDTAPVIGVFVEKAGWDMEKDGGLPVAMVQEAGAGSETMSKDAGDYNIFVKSANCDWTVTVEEKR